MDCKEGVNQIRLPDMRSYRRGVKKLNLFALEYADLSKQNINFLSVFYIAVIISHNHIPVILKDCRRGIRQLHSLFFGSSLLKAPSALPPRCRNKAYCRKGCTFLLRLKAKG